MLLQSLSRVFPSQEASRDGCEDAVQRRCLLLGISEKQIFLLHLWNAFFYLSQCVGLGRVLCWKGYMKDSREISLYLKAHYTENPLTGVFVSTPAMGTCSWLALAAPQQHGPSVQEAFSA